VTRLIASTFGVHLWGYIFFVATGLFIVEFFVPGRYNRDARNWLYAILVLYLGLGALGFVLPLINLNETTKRAMFKMLPLLALYLANNAALLRLSQWISRWEGKPVVIGGKLVAAAPKAAPAPASNKSKPVPGPSQGSSKKRRRK
jgi:hypothetical protein